MNQLKALLSAFCLGVLGSITASPVQAAMIDSNIVIFMDESGSTGSEAQPDTGYSNMLQSNVFSYLSDFHSVLTGRGIQANFALVGFGGSNSFVNLLTTEFTSAQNVALAAKKLIASGDSMGIYSAIRVALDNLNYSAGAIKNFIVFTDEHAHDAYTTRGTAEQLLSTNDVVLNSVMNGTASDDLAQMALRSGGDYFDVNTFKAANDAQAKLLMTGLANVKASEISTAFCNTYPTAMQCQSVNREVNAPAAVGLLLLGIVMVLIRRQRKTVKCV